MDGVLPKPPLEAGAAIVGAAEEKMSLPVDTHAIDRESAVCACGMATSTTRDRTRISALIRIHGMSFRTVSAPF
jgi:hypothetical protein